MSMRYGVIQVDTSDPENILYTTFAHNMYMVYCVLKTTGDNIVKVFVTPTHHHHIPVTSTYTYPVSQSEVIKIGTANRPIFAMPPAPVNTPMFWENLSTMFLVSASAIGGIYLMTTDTRPMVVAAQT